MKWRGTYLVWILLALLVVLIAYSWNSRETFGNQCWSSEMQMGESTGYPNLDDGSLMSNTRDYMTIIGQKEIDAGRCVAQVSRQDPTPIPARYCANSSTLFLSSDFAKEYCSTRNCTAIIKGGMSGDFYFPWMNPLLSTPLSGGAADYAKAIILPVPCAPPPPPPPAPPAPPAPAPLAPPSMAPDVAGLNPQASNSLGQPPRTFTCTAN